MNIDKPPTRLPAPAGQDTATFDRLKRAAWLDYRARLEQELGRLGRQLHYLAVYLPPRLRLRLQLYLLELRRRCLAVWPLLGRQPAWRFRRAATWALPAALTATMLAQPLVARAEHPTPLAPAFQVNTHTAGVQDYAQIAMDADGNSVVVWESPDSDGSGIFAQRFNSAGATVGLEFQVNTMTTGNQDYPSVAMDADGDFVIAWESQDSNGRGIFARRFASTGLPAGSEFQTHTITNADQVNPDVAVDADGDFVVAWQSAHSGSADIWAKRFQGSNGAALGSEFRVNSITIDNQVNPSVARDADGDFVVTWLSYGRTSPTPPTPLTIQAQRFDAAGTRLGPEFLVNTGLLANETWPQVAMDADGDFTITWEEGLYFIQDIYARRFDRNGTPQAAGQAVMVVDPISGLAVPGQFRVNTAPVFMSPSIPVIGMEPDGDFIIAWNSSIDSTNNSQIVAQRFTGSGARAGDEFGVSPRCVIVNSSIAVDADGDFMVTWDQDDAGDIEVLARRFSPALIEELQANPLNHYNQTRPGVAMDSDGDFVVAWQHMSYSYDNYAVYAQRFDQNGDYAGAEFQVTAFTAAEPNPSVAMDNDGDFVVAYQVYDHPADVYTEGIFARRFDASGAPDDGEFRVNTTIRGDQTRPSVAMNAGGSFVVTWEGEVTVPVNNTNIYAQRVTAGGSLDGSEFMVNQATGGDQAQPSVAMDTAGNFVVAWQAPDASGLGVYARRFDQAGVGGTEFLVNPPSASGSQVNPSVAMDADGDFVVAWQSYNIFAQRFQANGAPAGSIFQVNTYTTADQANPAVAMDAAGNFIISWESEGQDGHELGVCARTFQPDGTPNGPEVQVNGLTHYNQALPAVAAAPTGGDAVVAWQSNAMGSYDVFAKRLTGVLGLLKTYLPSIFRATQ